MALGGSSGAAARYLVSQWASERFGGSFPYGTLIVNVVGCFFIIDFFAAWLGMVITRVV